MVGDIGIVIVAHGQLAHEYRAAVEHVVGPQPNIVAVSIAAECDRNNKELEICEAVDSVDNGCGVVIAIRTPSCAQRCVPSASAPALSVVITAMETERTLAWSGIRALLKVVRG